MTDRVDITSLLERPEGETLDFKAIGYDLSESKKRRDFAKDLASLANTPREGNAYIVLGVKQLPHGELNFWGIETNVDDAQLQSVASDFLEPTPRFTYEVVQHKGVDLGLITVHLGQETPAVAKKTIDSGFVKETIYFRRGSKNDAASTLEQGRIWDWFHGKGVKNIPTNPYIVEPAWTRYLTEVSNLSPVARHILVTDARLQGEVNNLSGIGTGPWAFTFDFDTRGDKDGLLASVKDKLEQHRAVHIRVKGDQPTSRSPEFTTTWYFVRGLEGRSDSLTEDHIRHWRRAYRQALTHECELLAREMTPNTVYVTILWHDGEFNEHLKELFNCLDESLHDSFRPVFVTETPEICKHLADDFDGKIIEMSFSQFALGVQQLIRESQLTHPGTVMLPSSSGVAIPLEPQIANWIAEEIEIVPLEVPSGGEDDVETFLRGGIASWADLDRNIDARRDIQNRLTEAVRRDLLDRRTTRFNLYHRPGAGGTTVVRRVAWELHDEFPSGLLQRTNPLETAGRIARIYEETAQPVLLIADGADIAESELDELAEHLGGQQIPVVLLQARRRIEAHQQRPRAFDLNSELSPREVSRFVSTLSRDIPDRATAINQFSNKQNQVLHIPVYFALTAYEGEFRALPEFVSSRIEGLNDDQKKVLVFAAIALRYGQSSLPASALKVIFGLTTHAPINVPSLLPPITGELFVETAPGTWRIGHSLVADELLKQMLTVGVDPRTWLYQLADWGVKFIRFCRGDLPIASDAMLDLIRSVFVKRDDRDVLGQEQSVQRRFSHFIEDIPIIESRIRVLEALVESYPGEHHFWAHLARFYALEYKDFPRALEAADHAVQLSDSDSIVYHMRGMVRRYQLTELLRNNSAVDDLVLVAEKASSDFKHSRSLNPENEHGYIAEAQMLLDLLEYVSRRSDSLFQFLSRRNIHPYLLQALDHVEYLLAHVKRDREGVESSQYERRASARVRKLYGDYSGAIQRLDSLLSRSGVYQPPIRRQLAWIYLSRAEGDWSQVPKRQLERVVNLLVANLKEEQRGDQNIKMWMQASRFVASPPTVADVFEQVQYWRTGPMSVDAIYYAYVLNALMTMDGTPLARQRYEKYLEECRERTSFRRNRHRSYEWLGKGRNIACLVHQSHLGDWDHGRDFWKNPGPLKRIQGRVARINGPQAGYIEFEGGLQAFFVPARSGLSLGSENTPVLAFLGFTYNGPRAWDILRDER